jgi:ferrous iron transport protein B
VTASVAADTAPEAPAEGADRVRLVLLAGNPNAGKTTVFNSLTGARAKVGNYPGVTVDRRSGLADLPGGGRVEVVDLPGTYSLSARSPEEEVAVDAILGRGASPPDAVIVVADATALARNLYLVVQVIETGVPTLVALSIMDEARSRGLTIDTVRLGERLGAEVVPVVASRNEGKDALVAAIARACALGPREPHCATPLDSRLEDLVRPVEAAVTAAFGPVSGPARRAWALWAILSLGDDELGDVAPELRAAAAYAHRAAQESALDLDASIIGARYRLIEQFLAESVTTPPPTGRSLTERIDAVVTHWGWGTLVFATVMFVVFQALFSWSEPAISAVQTGIAVIQSLTSRALPAGPLRDLLSEGVVAGVGNVLVFVPQIALLFLFIGVLEDSGYLARVAFLMDRLMGGVGLHGKAFVPMLSGFACAVPAVMATRTIENRRDRLLTMLVVPLASCSARLPVYVLITATVFDPALRWLGLLSVGAVVLFSMYALSVTAALGAAAVLRRTALRGPRPTLVLELPPYRMPVARNLLLGAWQRIRTFLVDAGTLILAVTIVLWALLSYPKVPGAAAAGAEEGARLLQTAAGSERGAQTATLHAREKGEQLRQSLAGRIGRAIEPAIAPLGFDWRIGVGILGAFAAREVFVSTMGIVFDIEGADEHNPTLREALRKARREDGTRLMTPLVGVSLMVFFVLACQCMSTIAVVRRESGSWGWTAFMVGYMTLLSYAAALGVRQVGLAAGWGP